MARRKPTPEERKAGQARRHKKWRESEKGKAYALKRKLRDAGVLQ